MHESLATDLYEATMAASYVRRGMTGRATFSLFTRRLPEQRGFLVAAGLADAVDRLLAFELTGVDVIALADQLGCPRSLFSPLQGMRFTGDVWAVPEGRVVLADEPLLEVTAPLPEAQFVETLVLNAVCYQTLLASKAARCVLAAEGRPVVDFSLRRAHGEEAGLCAARAAAIAGFVATSNVAAALRYGLRATGTMAHSYVQAFPSEEEAFRAFATDFPAAPVFLVDTFDLADGVHAAARVIEELGLADRAAIRIDSGDIERAARTGRAILDEHGLRRVRIVASGGLDEFLIDRCVRRGVPIDVFAVGTRFGVSADAPVLDAAYKLVQVDERLTMKLSPGKATAPGAKQVFRRPHYDDLLGLRGEPVPADGEPLLVPIMRAGRLVSPPDPLAAAQKRCTADLMALPPTARQLRNPVAPTCRWTEGLAAVAAELRAALRSPVAGERPEPSGREEVPAP